MKSPVLRLFASVLFAALIAGCSGGDQPQPAAEQQSSAPQPAAQQEQPAAQQPQQQAQAAPAANEMVGTEADAQSEAEKRGVGVGDEYTTESGLRIVVTGIGEGRVAAPGDRVLVNYTGWIYNEDGSKGEMFDSSFNRMQPFQFPLGAGRVIKGWDEGVAGMREGGSRTLIIPSELAYGDRGAGNKIPPGATLMFDVKLEKTFTSPSSPEQIQQFMQQMNEETAKIVERMRQEAGAGEGSAE